MSGTKEMSVPDQVVQGYQVYRAGDAFYVRGQIDLQEVKATETADEAIQFAIDTLGDGGGEVLLGKGLFPLAAPVRLKDQVWLRGGGRGTKLVVTDDNRDGIGLRCRDLKGVEISNLAVIAGDNRGAKTGILLDNSGGCKLHDLHCAGFADYGIWVRNNVFLCEIRGCSVAGNGRANIFLENLAAGTYGSFIPNLVANCTVYGGGKGIECQRTIVLNIVGCVVYQTDDVAYYVGNTSNSVLISGCRSFQIGTHAVVADNSHEFNLSSNIFCWHTGHGVVINDCGWGTISGNEIIDSGSFNSGRPNFTTPHTELPEQAFDGIRLTAARGFTVTGNAIFNWPTARRMRMGIFEDEASYDNAIIANNLNYIEKDDIVAQGKNTVVDNNVVNKDRAHFGNRDQTMGQSFQTELTQQFIDELMA